MSTAGVLTIQHQHGPEVRDLTQARMHLTWMPSESEDREFDQEIVLSFEAANPPSSGQANAAGHSTTVNGEFRIKVDAFSEQDFVGSRFRIPRGYDEVSGEYLTRLYYFEHLEPDHVEIEVLEFESGRYRVQIRATCEIDTYGGSGPPSQILIDGWFDWSAEEE